MTNNELLKKQIIYRSSHRGSKEMDLLLTSFVKKYLNTLNDFQLKDLDILLSIDDETIYNWYFKNIKSVKISTNKVTKMLNQFVLHKNL